MGGRHPRTARGTHPWQVHGRLYTTWLAVGNEKDAPVERAPFRRGPTPPRECAPEARLLSGPCPLRGCRPALGDRLPWPARLRGALAGEDMVTGMTFPLEYRPPTANKSVKVDAEAFEEALTQLLLEAPLTLRPLQQGGPARASSPSDGPDTRWQRLMIKSFVGICEPGQRKKTCLCLLDDVMGLSKHECPPGRGWVRNVG